jgi:hypothetical protein
MARLEKIPPVSDIIFELKFVTLLWAGRSQPSQTTTLGRPAEAEEEESEIGLANLSREI